MFAVRGGRGQQIRALAVDVHDAAGVLRPAGPMRPMTSQLSSSRGRPAGWAGSDRVRSILDAFLGRDAPVVDVLHLAHLGDRVGHLDQLRDAASRPVITTLVLGARFRIPSTTVVRRAPSRR